MKGVDAGKNGDGERGWARRARVAVAGAPNKLEAVRKGGGRQPAEHCHRLLEARPAPRRAVRRRPGGATGRVCRVRFDVC